MTEIDSLLPTPSNDTLVSYSDLDRVDIDDTVISEGHQQTLAADGNFHSSESNVTFNTTQENEASNTNADSKHPAPSAKAPMPAPSEGSGRGPSTPIVKKVSIYNVLLVNALNNSHLDYQFRNVRCWFC